MLLESKFVIGVKEKSNGSLNNNNNNKKKKKKTKVFTVRDLYIIF